MATAYFYTLTKRKNSTLQPTGGTSLDVNLKSGTSLVSPTFLLNLSSTPMYNYVSFEGRYYFITDIVSVRNDLWELQCEIDVLATYKTEILASTQFVSYSSSHGDTWLADTRIPVLRSTVAAKNTTPTGILSRIGCYILSVVGKESAATYMFYTDSGIKDIIKEISNWQQTGITQIEQLIDTTDTDTLLASLCEVLTNTGFVGNAYSQAPSCIRSCLWVPFDYALAPISNSDQIYLGNFDTGISGSRISSKPVTDSTSVSIPWHFSDWRRGYCEDVYLYLPLVGMVSIAADSITNVSSLTIDWSVTYTDGTISYEVKAGNQIIGTYGANCSANYPIGINQQASIGEIVNTMISGVEKVVSYGVNSSLSPVSAGAASAGMIAEVGVTAYQVANAAANSHASCIGGIGGGAGIGLDTDIACYTVAHNTIVNPADMKDTMGLPTMKPTALSTLSGYCECTNGHVAIDGTLTEMATIDNYINSGFYIE